MNASRSRGKRVVIVDDDDDLVQALSMRCRNVLGLGVHWASDRINGVKLIDQLVPDLICLDINMPYGNGFDVLEMLSRDDCLSSIPAIVLTGRSDEKALRRCEDFGAHYLLKTSDCWNSLSDLMCELLELAKPRAKSAEPTAGVGCRGQVPSCSLAGPS